MLFREKQVDNLMKLIYEEDEDQEMAGQDADTEETLDTYRYDVAPEKLAMYRRDAVKSKLKKKFVTGQT